MTQPSSRTREEDSHPVDEPGALDAIVVGAGFAGLYQLHRLRAMGLSARVFDAADNVGGTWYWNRYPGARCDVESIDYCYSFSEELQREWTWSVRFASQPEILRYLNYVVDRFALRSDITFGTRVISAQYDELRSSWTVRTDRGYEVSAQFLIMATGCLSVGRIPDIAGLSTFSGPAYHTSAWPRGGANLAGMRVGVIGTGSSGIQVIPMIARDALQLTVFQRTPHFTLPAGNHPLSASWQAEFKQRYPGYSRRLRKTVGGQNRDYSNRHALETPPDERHRIYEARWAYGGAEILGAFADLLVDEQANDTVAEFVRMKLREMVSDARVAEILTPVSYPFGAKRMCIDTGYYETFNRENVSLVDLNATPIEEITTTGIRTSQGEYGLDAIVFATGFDALTGALLAIDIRGRRGARLGDKWSAGPRTFLGLSVAGFPNLFIITGPGSPSVLSNVVVSIEQHVEWISDLIGFLRKNHFEWAEPHTDVEDEWVAHVNAVANETLLPRANSWYLGANVPGKPRVFMPYVGGVGHYRAICDRIAAENYAGFQVGSGPHIESKNDEGFKLLRQIVRAEFPTLSDVPGAWG